ncbi:hypothetical protein FI667_g6586, partial [Globisporangium splendens]
MRLVLPLALSSLLLFTASTSAAPVAVSPFRAASEHLQQEYDRFELDELRYALLSGPRAVRTDAVLRDREKILQRIKDDIPDTVPADVKCDRVTYCDKNKVCAIVCKPGSVVVDEWLQKTLRLQRKVAYRRNFCNTQLPGSHNSAINIADGYGVEDHVFEGYLKYLSWFKTGIHVHTNDQLFSLTDQMQMGVRFIEIDVHWFDGDLRIAHCGGFRSELLDGFISALNEVAKLIGTDIQWDSETIGCKPSLSSIPSSEQRPLNAALQELATWLHAPENKDEFLMVFFDDETNLLKWKKVQTLLKYLKDHFSMDEILLPSDLVHGQGWPTVQELLDVGKRVVFMSGSDYSPDGDELLFVKDDICGWLEPALPFQPFPTCRFKHSNIGPLDENRTIFRPQTSEIEYGFLNAGGRIGTNEYLLNELSLPPMVDCGVNLPSPDNITPKRMESTVWVLKRGETLEKGKCVGITRDKPTWHSVDCGAPSMVAGCVHDAHPNRWSLGREPVEEAQSASSCQSLLATGEMVYSAPASGYENKLVHELLMDAPPSVVGVWVNAKQLVDEVYASSSAVEEEEEEAQATGKEEDALRTSIQQETAVLSIE